MVQLSHIGRAVSDLWHRLRGRRIEPTRAVRTSLLALLRPGEFCAAPRADNDNLPMKNPRLRASRRRARGKCDSGHAEWQVGKQVAHAHRVGRP